MMIVRVIATVVMMINIINFDVKSGDMVIVTVECPSDSVILWRTMEWCTFSR